MILSGPHNTNGNPQPLSGKFQKVFGNLFWARKKNNGIGWHIAPVVSVDPYPPQIQKQKKTWSEVGTGMGGSCSVLVSPRPWLPTPRAHDYQNTVDANMITKLIWKTYAL